MENWNSANDFILFGKGGELAANRREEQEVTMLALHLLQNAYGLYQYVDDSARAKRASMERDG